MINKRRRKSRWKLEKDSERLERIIASRRISKQAALNALRQVMFERRDEQ